MALLKTAYELSEEEIGDGTEPDLVRRPCGLAHDLDLGSQPLADREQRGLGPRGQT